MHDPRFGPISVLTRKLARFVHLSSEDVLALKALPLREEGVPRFRDLVIEGQAPESCCLLIRGYACRYKETAAGSRQIVSFHLAGDLLDIQHLLLERADHSVQTITEAVVGWIPRAALLQLTSDRPNVGRALWKDCLVDASIFREWVLNVGQRDARSAIAHMLCEFVARSEAAGLGNADSFELPMTQSQIGEATGLTAVHVNRTLKLLDADGAIARDGRHFRVVNWQRLCAIADFDRAYLHAAA